MANPTSRRRCPRAVVVVRRAVASASAAAAAAAAAIASVSLLVVATLLPAISAAAASSVAASSSSSSSTAVLLPPPPPPPPFVSSDRLARKLPKDKNVDRNDNVFLLSTETLEAGSTITLRSYGVFLRQEESGLLSLREGTPDEGGKGGGTGSEGPIVWSNGYSTGNDKDFFSHLQSDGHLLTKKGKDVDDIVWETNAHGTVVDGNYFFGIAENRYAVFVARGTSSDVVEILWSDSTSFNPYAKDVLMAEPETTGATNKLRRAETIETVDARLVAQTDGNVVLREGTASSPGPTLWDTGKLLTTGEDYYLRLQNDGHLIAKLDSTKEKLWGTDATGAGNEFFLAVTRDANGDPNGMAVYRGTVDFPGATLWTSGTTAPSPTDPPSSRPSSGPTGEPSGRPTGSPSRPPTSRPSTSRPTDAPSASPSETPTERPTLAPSGPSSSAPSGEPTREFVVATVPPTSSSPSALPSSDPTAAPSADPFEAPSAEPSSDPTGMPFALPSSVPSAYPSFHPTTESPSDPPSSSPAKVPSYTPSARPSHAPATDPTSPEPSATPSSAPSVKPSSPPPSGSPSGPPSDAPSDAPSNAPSAVPSSVPSSEPTDGDADRGIAPSVTPSPTPGSSSVSPTTSSTSSSPTPGASSSFPTPTNAASTVTTVVTDANGNVGRLTTCSSSSSNVASSDDETVVEYGYDVYAKTGADVSSVLTSLENALLNAIAQEYLVCGSSSTGTIRLLRVRRLRGNATDAGPTGASTFPRDTIKGACPSGSETVEGSTCHSVDGGFTLAYPPNATARDDANASALLEFVREKLKDGTLFGSDPDLTGLGPLRESSSSSSDNNDDGNAGPSAANRGAPSDDDGGGGDNSALVGGLIAAACGVGLVAVAAVALRRRGKGRAARRRRGSAVDDDDLALTAKPRGGGNNDTDDSDSDDPTSPERNKRGRLQRVDSDDVDGGGMDDSHYGFSLGDSYSEDDSVMRELQSGKYKRDVSVVYEEDGSVTLSKRGGLDDVLHTDDVEVEECDPSNSAVLGGTRFVSTTNDDGSLEWAMSSNGYDQYASPHGDDNARSYEPRDTVDL